MKFNLRSPCDSCPFRTDRPGFLHPARAREIAGYVLQDDKTFACHKTLDRPRIDRSHCAGALVMDLRHGRPNAMLRLAQFLGLYEPAQVNRDAPVYADADAMAAGHDDGGYHL